VSTFPLSTTPFTFYFVHSLVRLLAKKIKKKILFCFAAVLLHALQVAAMLNSQRRLFVRVTAVLSPTVLSQK